MNRENKHIIDDLKVTPIQMPSDSYFEDLKKSILHEIGNDFPTASGIKKKEPGIISMYKRWYIWGSAAAILVFIILFPWNSTNSPTNSEPVNLSSVSDSEIYQYLNENIEDLDTETIALHLSEETMALNGSPDNQNQETPESVSQKSILPDDIKDEEILDYLDDESGELDEYLLIEG